MNLIEIYPSLVEASKNLIFSSSYVSGRGDTPYQAKDLKLTRQIVKMLEGISILKKEVDAIEQSWIFQTSNDEQFITSSEHAIGNIISNLQIKAKVLQDFIEESGLVGLDNLLFIKLPDFKSFDELAKYANDLKKAIELPLTEINEETNIIGADKGSVILYVTVGTLSGIGLVAKLCWAAAVIRKKRAEARIFEAHAKTLDLKNESLQLMVDAQGKQLKNILEAEATAIANHSFDHQDPETVRRLELSIDTISNLIEKGGKILPMSNDNEITKSFPNYNAQELIESSIRQLPGGDVN